MLIKLLQRTTLRKHDLAILYQQLATLLSAGIPLLNSIQMLQNMQISLPIKIFLTHIHENLLSGQTLFNTLQHDPHHIHAFARQLIYIGEQIGRLDYSLRMIADHYESEIHYQHQIKQALLYPFILCCTAILMTLCLLIFIIPRFAILFEDHPLPVLTQIIFSISGTIQHHYLLVSLPLIYLIFIFLPISYAEPHRLALIHTILTIPLLMALQKKINLARFCNQLSLLYQAGIPLTDSIQLIATVTSATEHRLAMQNIQAGLLNGLSLYQATSDTTYFPTPLPEMIQIGELSGNLDAMLKHLTILYEGEIERTLKHISQLLEPLIMMILGVLIGGLVIGMYLPIFNLGSII